jgi:hypothetical protein
MVLIIKCDPPISSGDSQIIAEARARKGTSPEVGQRIFLWIAETSNGDGLSARGKVMSVEKLASGKTRLRIKIDKRKIATPLRKADLLPHRDTNDGTPISRLARALYFQAHNKISMISPSEENFLDARFENF